MASGELITYESMKRSRGYNGQLDNIALTTNYRDITIYSGTVYYVANWIMIRAHVSSVLFRSASAEVKLWHLDRETQEWVYDGHAEVSKSGAGSASSTTYIFGGEALSSVGGSSLYRYNRDATIWRTESSTSASGSAVAHTYIWYGDCVGVGKDEYERNYKGKPICSCVFENSYSHPISGVSTRDWLKYKRPSALSGNPIYWGDNVGTSDMPYNS